MSNENKIKSKRKLAIKILITILFIFSVGGIWIAKNFVESGKAIGSDNADKTAETANTDFALNVTKEIDMEKLKSYGIPIIIDFGAESCIPCKEMAPVLKELNKELQGKAIIKFVDVWKYKSFANGYPISVIPTQIYIDANGKPYTPKDPDTLKMKIITKGESKEHTFTAHEGGMTKEQLMSVLKEMGME